jgi:uncharacterized protein with LGFP repeats
VGDQAVDGDVVSQQFSGGKISWNRAKNAFTTDPANLAPLLSGLQVSGQNQPSTSAMPSHGKKFTWQWWWLLAAIPVLVLIVLAALLATGWRRRRRYTAVHEPERDLDAGYDAAVDGHWGHDDADIATEHLRFDDLHAPEHQPPPDAGSAGRVSWTREAGPAAGLAEDAERAGEYGEVVSESDEDAGYFEAPVGIAEGDPDAVDTDSIPVVSEAVLAEAGYPEVPEEADYEEADYAEVDYAESDYADVAHEDGGYADAGYPDVAVPHTPPDAAYLAAGTPETAEPDAAYPEAAAPEPHVEDTAVPDAVAPGAEPRSGRHAAADAEEEAEFGYDAAPAGRPTIHLPLDDPYQAPDGYPIKASARFGLYYTPGSDLYHDTLAEIWLSSEEVAQANGFIKAD